MAGSIYTTEIGKYYTLGSFFSLGSQQLNIYQNTAGYH